MKRVSESYTTYLEAVIISLLYEREQNGQSDGDDIFGIDFRGVSGVSYSPYNIKEYIQTKRKSDAEQH